MAKITLTFEDAPDGSFELTEHAEYETTPDLDAPDTTAELLASIAVRLVEQILGGEFTETVES